MGKLIQHNIRNQSGFTLVELAVVLGIVSILVVGSATLFKEQRVDVEQEVVSGKLEAAKVALLAFAEKNNYLPCPDANVRGETGFGQESRLLNQTATLAAVPAVAAQPAQAATASAPFIPAVAAQPAQPARTVTVDTCAVDAGTLPFEMIGLSLSDVTDAEGNLFHYAVTQSVTEASLIANCPENSACFFNHNNRPAFDQTTEPVAGRLGVNTLRICSEDGCLGNSLLSDGLIVVLVAFNKHATNGLSELDVGERENRNGDQTFIQSRYLKGEGNDYFDDLLVAISGAELKRGGEKTFQRNSVATNNGGTTLSGNDILNMGDNSVGTSGTNIGTDAAIWDRVKQVFDFGAEAANQEIVLTYDTYVVGAWDQPTNSWSNITSDTGTVSSNGQLIKEYKYDHTDGDFDGVVKVTFVAGDLNPNVVDTYTLVDTYNAQGEIEPMTVTEGVTYETYQPYWNESTEVVLQADENGQIDLEFAVGTTATIETIDFTNIELVYYDAPPPVPEFPSVEPIQDIPQTEGLQ